MKKFVGNDVHLMVVVKGNAYGFGALDVAEISISSGASWIGVATLDEALYLRHKLSSFVPILVLGYVDPHHLPVVSHNNITVTAVSLEWVQEADKLAQEPFDFHLKLDTGLNRIGCKTVEEVRSVSEIVTQNPHLKWTGAFTHFATADSVVGEGLAYYYKQLETFDKFLTVIPDVNKKIIHCATSGTVLYHSNKPFFNMVRIGRAIYGFLDQHLMLVPLQRPIKLFYSTIIHVKQLEAGESVGYKRTVIATQQQWVGTVATGFVDGWCSSFSMESVLINGTGVPIIGGVAMDQLMLALPERYPVGTIVTFIAREANETSKLDFNLYPLATNRVPRVYYLNGSVSSIRNILLDSLSSSALILKNSLTLSILAFSIAITITLIT